MVNKDAKINLPVLISLGEKKKTKGFLPTSFVYLNRCLLITNLTQAVACKFKSLETFFTIEFWLRYRLNCQSTGNGDSCFLKSTGKE